MAAIRKPYYFFILLASNILYIPFFLAITNRIQKFRGFGLTTPDRLWPARAGGAAARSSRSPVLHPPFNPYIPFREVTPVIALYCDERSDHGPKSVTLLSRDDNKETPARSRPALEANPVVSPHTIVLSQRQ
jgi:hypothetical protein